MWTKWHVYIIDISPLKHIDNSLNRHNFSQWYWFKNEPLSIWCFGKMLSPCHIDSVHIIVSDFQKIKNQKIKSFFLSLYGHAYASFWFLFLFFPFSKVRDLLLLWERSVRISYTYTQLFLRLSLTVWSRLAWNWLCRPFCFEFIEICLSLPPKHRLKVYVTSVISWLSCPFLILAMEEETC